MSPSRKAAHSRREEVHSSDDANHHDAIHDRATTSSPSRQRGPRGRRAGAAAGRAANRRRGRGSAHVERPTSPEPAPFGGQSPCIPGASPRPSGRLRPIRASGRRAVMRPRVDGDAPPMSWILRAMLRPCRATPRPIHFCEISTRWTCVNSAPEAIVRYGLRSFSSSARVRACSSRIRLIRLISS
jgi:hypothetical protein